MDLSSSPSRSILENLKTKKKREPIPIRIIETGSAEPSFKTKPKRKHIIGSVPLFKTVSEPETDVSPMHSEYIQNVLRRKVSQPLRLTCIKIMLTVLLK